MNSMNPTARPRRRTAFAASFAALAAAAVAQVQPQQPTPTTPQPQRPAFLPQQPLEPVPPPFYAQPQGGGQPGVRDSVDETTPIWMQPQRAGFNGFPVFPSKLSGYGNYPLPVDPTALVGGEGAASGGGPFALLLPPAPPEPPGWPGWVRTASKEPLPYAADLGLLVRTADRVWWRSAAAEPFVPLFFHRKFQTLTSGSEVEVRRAGAFELQLHDSTHLIARGTTRVHIQQLDDKVVRLAIGALTWLRIESTGRDNTITLPDGSELFLAAPPPIAATPAAPALPTAGLPFGALPLLGAAPANDNVLPREARVEFERANEPGFYGGRATVANIGAVPVEWRHAFGTCTLAPGERLHMFLTPPTQPIQAPLTAIDAEVDERGADVTCRPLGAGAELRFCGARIAVPSGTTVALESLQGNAFAAPPPPAPAAAAPATTATTPAATPTTPPTK